MSTMLDMNHANNPEPLQNLWQQVYDKYYPDKKNKAVLNLNSFGGVEKRRTETYVSILLFDNQPLLKHLDMTIAKSSK